MKFYTSGEDDPPPDELWDDPMLKEAWFEEVGRRYDARDHVDEDETWLPSPGADAWPAQDVRDEFLPIEEIVRQARAMCAEQDRFFHATLVRAATDPDSWVGADPTLDPLWEPPRGLSVTIVRARRRELAVRSAAADLAMRVHLSEQQIRSRAHRAEILSIRCPLTWGAYLRGDVAEQNATTATLLAASLPDDEPTWTAFDESIADAVIRLAPGKFRIRARAARERAHPESVDERHGRAMKDRGVWFTADLDGMTTVNAVIPAAKAHAIDGCLDDTARHLTTQDGETRTLAQVRADIFTDLLLGQPLLGSANEGGDASGSRPVTATVHVTIPVLTLLGRSDEPATLDGYGPIDLNTARDLAAGAKSWIRVLTHPVTGTVLDVDRRSYRVPKDLRRWLGVQHPTCIFPGCCRPSDRCDIDHRKRWADGGTTTADNLGPLCRSHHPLKDETLWKVSRDPATRTLTWTSPSGYTVDADPPPF